MFEPVIRAASAANPQKAGDYIQDDLLHCGICHTPKQCRINLMGKERVVSCMCRCAKNQAAEVDAERRRQEEADRIMRLRNAGITSQTHRNARFDADDGKNQAPMAVLRRYAENWEIMKRDKHGLLLYGGVGTGKSYGAACIANHLIERKTPVCMVNLSSVLNSISGYQSEDKNSFIADLMRYPLLILDDVGMERQTEYAMEQVFNVIDARYRSGMPLIVTTNLSLAELKAPRSRDHARIYDRILEMCLPVNFGSHGRRAEIARDKMRRAAELLGDVHNNGNNAGGDRQLRL